MAKINEKKDDCLIMSHETITVQDCELNAESGDECIILHNGQVIRFNIIIYSAIKEQLFRLAKIVEERHRKVYEQWNDGEAVECWLDNDRNFCIKYESGVWWHYRNVLSGKMSWW